MSMAGEKTNYLYKCSQLIEVSHASQVLVIARLSMLFFLIGAPVIYIGEFQRMKTISSVLCDSLDTITCLLLPK